MGGGVGGAVAGEWGGELWWGSGEESCGGELGGAVVGEEL